jgi:(1->4)-alpha-D-glucan 1-alpha-D-glucosylmutase
MREYLVKAVREAKVHTVWVKPDREYEEGFLEFLDRILDAETGRAFRESFEPFQRRIARYGMWNGLAQTLVKIASPGIPDFYQGSELWDLNLVDPDNRRPVDYARRGAILQDILARENADLPGLLRDLLDRPEDGRCKLFLISRALRARAGLPAVFQFGEYLPLAVEGLRKDSVAAFARTFGNHWMIAAVPRFLAGFVPEARPPLGPELWADTRLRIPGDAPARWRDVLAGGETSGENGSLALGEVFARFPAALLEGRV